MEKINRRDFLKLVGAGGVGTGAGVLFGESTKMSVELLMPQVVPPEDYSPGIATWYNSVCGQCSAGCGISVRTREGRAKKIEGNPLHPVNQGGLCALGQAGLNVLYNPDRIRTPLKRVGERGSGEYAPIGWDEALTTLSGRLSTLRIGNKAEHFCLLSGGAPGHLGPLLSQFMAGLGSSRYLTYDFNSQVSLRRANELSFGVDRLPYYDIENCGYLISFGADYLGSWISPVHHGLSYGQMRQGGTARGHTVQIEARMSLSGANADEWVAAKPGSEGAIALAIAHEIVDSLGYNGVDRAQWLAALADHSPEAAAEQSGLSEETIRRLAKEFVTRRPALAIGGGNAAAGSNGVATLVAINTLNYLVGNLNRPGGILFNPAPLFDGETAGRDATYSDLMDLATAAERGELDTLVVHDCNPLFTLPHASGFRQALEKIPFIAALTSFLDETSAVADLILPTDSYLESWGDAAPQPGVGLPVAAIAQPVVKKLYDTLSPGDIVLQLGHQIGGDLPNRLPWDSYETYIKETWQRIYREKSGDATPEGFDEFWHAALQAGVWGETGDRSTARGDVSGKRLLANLSPDSATFSGDEEEYPFYLQPYLTSSFGDGRGANLPWIQELPDPLTSVVYNTWVELNPVTARELEVEEGDVIAIESTEGTIEAPVFIYPAIRPDVVAIPVGQGHEHYGRYAKGRGVNPLSIVAPRVDSESGALAWSGSRVKISATGRHVRLAKTSGVTRTLGRQILASDHAKAPDYL